MTAVPALEVENLKTVFRLEESEFAAVDGVSFAVNEGEVLGIVGESGSGKSVTAFSIIGLVDQPGEVVDGRILYRGKDLRSLTEEQLRSVRGSRISMVFQDPLTTLNPMMRVGRQLTETIAAHEPATSAAEARRRAVEALESVGISDAERRMAVYPHQLSGGLRQRVAIAIAIINKPDVIIADEPTTALDVTIQAQVLYVVSELCRVNRTGLIWVSHDVAVVSSIADKIAVMYAGKFVEYGRTRDVISNPRHPYTVGLLRSIPSSDYTSWGKHLTPIPGTIPKLTEVREGCAFAPRCDRRRNACETPIGMTGENEHRYRCIFPEESSR